MPRRLIVAYEPHLKEIARSLRYEMTFSREGRDDAVLWGKKMGSSFALCTLAFSRAITRL